MLSFITANGGIQPIVEKVWNYVVDQFEFARTKITEFVGDMTAAYATFEAVLKKGPQGIGADYAQKLLKKLGLPSTGIIGLIRGDRREDEDFANEFADLNGITNRTDVSPRHSTRILTNGGTLSRITSESLRKTGASQCPHAKQIRAPRLSSQSRQPSFKSHERQQALVV